SGDAAVPDRDAAVPDRDAAVPDRDAALPDRDAAVPDRDAAVQGLSATPKAGATYLVSRVAASSEGRMLRADSRMSWPARPGPGPRLADHAAAGSVCTPSGGGAVDRPVTGQYGGRTPGPDGRLAHGPLHRAPRPLIGTS